MKYTAVMPSDVLCRKCLCGLAALTMGCLPAAADPTHGNAGQGSNHRWWQFNDGWNPRDNHGHEEPATPVPQTAQSWDPTDNDEDGLPDAFEIAYFGDLLSSGTDDNDGDGLPNSLEFSSDRDPTLAETITGTPDSHAVPGALLYERWDNIPGCDLASFYSSAAYRQSPASAAGFVTSAESTPDQGDEYGLRLRGKLRAPVSGDYRFFIASDNQGELYLGTDESPFTMRRLCRVDSWTDFRSWEEDTMQASGVVTLVEGDEYYFEALMKEGGGGDHLSIGWIRPGETEIEVIPGRMPDGGPVVLTSWAPDPLDLDDDGLLDSWERATGLNPNSRTDHALIDSDGDGANNLTECQANTAPIPLPGTSGFCEWQKFLIGPNSGKLQDLTSSVLFAQLPAESGYFTVPEAGQDMGECFGRRIRGVITIPTTGTWTFYISGDESSGLWINPDGASRFGKTQVAFSLGATSFRDFTSRPTQISRAFNFTAGHKIYFEALYVEGYGDDHCSVGWSGPGFENATLVPSEAISVCVPETIQVGGEPVDNDVNNDSIPDDWQRTHGLTVTNTGAEAMESGEYGDPDGDGLTNYQEWQNDSDPLVANGIAGFWTHEWYGSVAGSRITDLLGASGLLRTPDLVRLSDTTEHFVNFGYDYGERFRATIKPAVAGDYTFWLSGDDEAELWLSTDGRKFNKRRIIFSAYDAFRSWEMNVGKKSEPVTLQANTSYFIEVLHKQQAGDGHVCVGWSLNSTNWAESSQGSFARQSSDGFGTVAARAIDGNCSGRWGSNSTTHTDDDENAWLEVNFGRNRPVTRVVLFNRVDEDTGSRLSNFRISLLDGNGDEIQGAAANFFEETGHAPPIFTWDLPTTVTARKVRVQLLGHNNDDNGYLSIAELQAYDVGTGSFPAGPIPASVLTSFVRDADDKDDDYLVDDWEGPRGLSATDNGLGNPDNGEYGDPDNDLLTNRDEWLLGTNPRNSDTDGDGYSDGEEVFFMGTDPCAIDFQAPDVVGNVAVGGKVDSSSAWVQTADGGMLSIENRGWIDYQVEVATTGYYVFEIKGRARGSAILTRETFPLEIYVDSKKVGSPGLTSLNGQPGTAAGFVGLLQPGEHTLRIWNLNMLPRRSLELTSVSLVIPAGDDADNNHVTDWIEQLLAGRNQMKQTSISLTSPYCLEGVSRDWTTTSINANGTTNPVSKGINDNWYADIALTPGTATPVTTTFENGVSQQTVNIDWQPFNIADQIHFPVRKNDSLLLTAFTPGTIPGQSTVAITLDGETLATTTADQPYNYQFTSAGFYTLTADYTGPNGPVTATATIEVVDADFGPAFPVYLRRARTWTVEGLPFTLPIEADRSLVLSPQSVQWGGRCFLVDATALGANTVIARTTANGPIVAKGEVTGILLSNSGNENLPVIQVLPNGDRLVELTVFVANLPTGGYVQIEIWLGGRMFTDGTSVKDLYADDFGEDGTAKVQILVSSDTGTVCHRIFLRDANGNIIGQM